ncbi:hypothetical protein Hanom_Chr09g00801681 [Helianthus anomalus]
MKYRTQTNMLPNVHEHKRTSTTSVHICSFNETNKILVRVRLFNKRTNTNELPAKRFTSCSLNVWFVYNPNSA